MPADTKPESGIKPTAPSITRCMLWKQFGKDIRGKEVQSAATYSYMWMADQAGHLFIGLLLQLTVVSLLEIKIETWLLGKEWSHAYDIWIVLVAIILGTASWEIKSYRTDVSKGKKGGFPVDKKLLSENAFTAAAYMWAGAFIGVGFQWPVEIYIRGVFVIVPLLLGVYFAGNWLRQKIIWQKASIPYLFRLANFFKHIDEAKAKELKIIMNGSVPPEAPSSRQVVIHGQFGSGRTSFACGIGTEFAFKSRKVRYLSFDSMLEISGQSKNRGDGPPELGSKGPQNILYWPWTEAQVLILDDISPLIGKIMSQGGEEVFLEILKSELGNIRKELKSRHTVWVFGESHVDRKPGETRKGNNSEIFNQIAKDIQKFLNSESAPLVIEVPPNPKNPSGAEGSSR